MSLQSTKKTPYTVEEIEDMAETLCQNIEAEETFTEAQMDVVFDVTVDFLNNLLNPAPVVKEKKISQTYYLTPEEWEALKDIHDSPAKIRQILEKISQAHPAGWRACQMSRLTTSPDNKVCNVSLIPLIKTYVNSNGGGNLIRSVVLHLLQARGDQVQAAQEFLKKVTPLNGKASINFDAL